MKTKILLLSFFILIGLVSISSAISTDIKETYLPGETAIIEISGNILEPIPFDNVEFRRGHVLVPFDYDIKKLDDKYYLWAVMPNTENNYTLIIKDITSTFAGNVEKTDYEKNFSVRGNLTDYSIKPGFVIAREDFEITAKLNEDFDKTITVNFLKEQEILLKPGENKLNFPIDDVNETGIIKIQIGKYSVPAYIILNKTQTKTAGNIIEFTPKYIRRDYDVGTYQISLKNTAQEKLDVAISLNKNVFSSIPDINDVISLAKGETFYFNLSLKDKTSRYVIEKIYASAKNFSASLPIEINLIKDKENITFVNASASEGLYYCAELAGTLCSSSEICNGKTEVSKDGLCCIGKCSVKETKSSSGWIGWLILILVLAAVFFLYKKYKKVKPESNIIKQAEKRIFP